jgi:hypothetical protein
MKYGFSILLAALWLLPGTLHAQGVTTAGLSGFVFDRAGEPLPGANVVAVHEPSGTTYGAATRAGGVFSIPNMRVGGPYTVTASFVSFESQAEEDVYLSLGQTLQLTFELAEQTVALEGVEVTAAQDEVLNADRTGAATFVNAEQVAILPTVSRSTRDLTRLDPRSDGNFSFGGRNWLFNNVSLDGSYFNNPFGLDDPAPGGQANAEPVPYDAIEQVQVSIAPFDVREGGFTGANINQVTRSGTNVFEASVYSFYRDENLIGNSVSGNEVIANPDLTFNQSGFAVGGPLLRDRLFFFVNGELSRRDDPGSNFVADRDGTASFGESRVEADVMEAIRQRMIEVYGYDPGPFEGYIHETDSDKLIAKLDWNVNERNNLSFRWNYLDARRDLGPHPFVLSFANTGRGPNENSLPFQNSGYTINNELNSFALELNSRGSRFSNRLFASYNRFRDFREPRSEPFPTVEIAEDGVTYTTVGHEPFSIHNILDQDVWQFTNNFSFFTGRHVVTAGANFELFSFFNSFNLFRHGFFGFDFAPNTFSSLEDFFERTDPESEDFVDLNALVTPDAVPFKGENIEVGQFALYVQDEFTASPAFNVTLGLRVDLPTYFTDPVANPFSTGLTALDEDDRTETVDQADLPGATPLFSPRLGFNWDPFGDRSTQVRGGTGVFTGRIPFVWFGNVISNPGFNPNLFPALSADEVPPEHETSDDSILQQSFDLNAMDEDFAWPQVWTTDLAVDQQLPGGFLGTLELIYGKDLNAIYMRNADLVEPVRFLADGRPFFGGFGANELNPDGGAGIYVIDNTSEGYNFNATAQLRKFFDVGLDASLAYSYTEAQNLMQSTEIASVLWQGNPVQGDPNRPTRSPSQFGQRHRIVGTATYRRAWSDRLATSVGLFLQVAEGNQFLVSGGNRYSFVYSGDVNGDGASGNDLIYVPRDASEINLADPSEWAALDAFIEQDDYLAAHRGEIAERFGAINPWYSTLDLRVLQDVGFVVGGSPSTLQITLDVQNLANLLNSDWGVRKVASPAATSPLTLVGFDEGGEPVFDFTGPDETFVDDPSEFSRWRAQLGLRYTFGG